MAPAPTAHPLIPTESEDVNLQNLPAECKPRPLPKGFDGAIEMGKGGGTLSQLKNELHIAAFTSDVDKVRRILSGGNATSNRYRVNAIELDSPPLILAVRVQAKDSAHDARIAEIAKLLLDAGADVNHTLQGEESPLILASIYAGGVGKVQTVRTLLAAGANLRQRDHRQKMTALHWAVVSGWHDVVEVLVNAGASCTTRGGKDKEDAAAMAKARLHKIKLGQAAATGPNDDATRKAEYEKMVATCEAGRTARLEDKADRKAARRAAKARGDGSGGTAGAADDESVADESVCGDRELELEDWDERGRARPQAGDRPTDEWLGATSLMAD